MESSHKLVSIAISGIPKELTKPEIENIFKEFGNVVACHIGKFKSRSTLFSIFPWHMAFGAQCEQFMRLKAQNAQYVSCSGDKTVHPN